MIKRMARGPAKIVRSGFRGHIGERSIAIVAIETSRAEASDVKVLVSIPSKSAVTPTSYPGCASPEPSVTSVKVTSPLL